MMAHIKGSKLMRTGLLFILILSGCIGTAMAADDDMVATVTTVLDEDGWRLQVDGMDFAIKGMVWAFTPIGENYAYYLWNQPEAYIQRIIDTDMTLLSKAGVNTIRCFSIIPPKWVEYIHDRYGIYTIVNDLFGRYGISVNGTWMPRTDYSDPAVVAALVSQARATAHTFKGVRGVLLYLLGNESNYGLEWSSTTIENLPSGERLEAKARFLYAALNEGIKAVKEVDVRRPVGIVNGDIQYLGLIASEVPELDILGVNAYRGKKAYGSFYESILEALDKPMFFTEMGSDAYNTASGMEDQYHQAEFLKSQWEEIYQMAWGKGKAGNCLGATVFEWIDEWWKHGMEEGLDVHDTTGTWSNGAYDFDAAGTVNNMNEEWFGIAGVSPRTIDGVQIRLPRAAYHVLSQIWKLDLYDSTSQAVQKHFAAISLEQATLQGMTPALNDRITSAASPRVWGEAGFRAYDKWTAAEGPDWDSIRFNGDFSTTQTVLIGMDWEPAEGLSAGLAFKIWGEPFDDGTTKVSFLPAPVDGMRQEGADGAAEIYQAHAEYRSEALDVDFYYHTGHPDWFLEGDWFGLLPETFDSYHQDEAGSKAPFGMEVSPKGVFEGLTVYAGPELWFGGFPGLMAKYWKDWGNLALGLVHHEELAYPAGFTLDDGSGPFTADEIFQVRPLTRASSLYFEGDWLPVIRVQAGALYSKPELNGRTYRMVLPAPAGSGHAGSDWYYYGTRILGPLDSLGGKLRLSTTAIPLTQWYLQGLWMGAVAESRATIARAGSQLADIGTGNRIEVESGALLTWGDFTFAPKFLYRTPVYKPIPDIAAANGDPAIAPRNWRDDPFMVFDNREAVQAEVVLGFDPSGATWLYNWDNDDKENAWLAAYVSGLYNFHLGATDAQDFISDTGMIYFWSKGSSLPAGGTARHGGLSAVDGTWSVQAKVVTNPGFGLRAVIKADAGRGQSVSVPDDRLVNWYGVSAQVAWDRLMVEGGARFDAWGPFQYNREFNQTWPLQWNVGVAYGFTPLTFMAKDNRLGLQLNSETLNAYSDLSNGSLGTRYEVQAYLNLSF